MKIVYKKWGMGAVYDNEICLNQNLLKPRWKTLHDWILKHELEHTQGRGITTQDLVNDLLLEFNTPQQMRKDYILFYLSNPSAWLHSLPIWYYKGKIWFDFQKLWTFTFWTVLIVGVWYLWLS